MQAVIFAGGMGKRMGIDLPKALIEVRNKTLLASSVENFLDAGIQEFVFMLGYQSDRIVPEIQGLHREFGIDYRIQIDTFLDCGRIIALKQALNDNIIRKSEPSCIHYVDDHITVPFRSIFAKVGNETLTLVVTDKVELPYEIVLNNEFIEKPVLNYCSFVGLYVVQPDFYHYVLDVEHKNPEDGIFNILFKERKVKVITIPYTSWIPINTRKDLERANGVQYKKFTS